MDICIIAVIVVTISLVIKMSVDYKLIGQRVKEKRKQKGFTQENLAEKLNVTVGYISQIERGVTKINLETLSAISVFCECDVSYFLTGTTAAQTSFMQEEIAKVISDLDSSERKLLYTIAKAIRDNE